MEPPSRRLPYVPARPAGEGEEELTDSEAAVSDDHRTPASAARDAEAGEQVSLETAAPRRHALTVRPSRPAVPGGKAGVKQNTWQSTLHSSLCSTLPNNLCNSIFDNIDRRVPRTLCNTILCSTPRGLPCLRHWGYLEVLGILSVN